MYPNALPIELRDRPQWVCWTSQERGGKQTKIPVNPTTGAFASTADADTWGTFDEVLAYVTQPDATGIGFVFTSEDPYVGVDLDDCRIPDTGELTDEAVDITMRLHSYTEISPSGTGLHVIARGELPDGQRRHGSVEMYEDGRFFTMTGERLPATPEQVCDREEEIRVVHQRYVADSTSKESKADSASTPTDRELSFTSSVGDDEVIEKAKAATNGEKFSALWEGSIEGYESHSEADMALCCLLAFWTEGDASRVDTLFRDSGLMRPKWDEAHYSDGTTYGERTAERACARISE